MRRVHKDLSVLQHRETRQHAFTLIELLVVVAIIGLLIAILLPSLAGARHAAKMSNCLSNIRQAAITINVYANDSKGFTPRVQDPSYGTVNPSFDPSQTLNKTWVNLLVDRGYIDWSIETNGVPAMLRCPNGANLDNDPTWAGHMPHYGLNVFTNPAQANEAAMGKKSFGGKVPQFAAMDSNKILLVESRQLDNNRGWFSPGNYNWVATNRHATRGAVTAFLDSRAEFKLAPTAAPASDTDATHPFASMYFVRQLTP